MSQLFEKKTKSPQSKKILCVYFPIFFPELNGSTNFLSRLVLLSQLFEKKTKSPQSKKILCVYFPIFLSELNGSTNFLF
ncbi:hypothetical protein CYV26_10355 [Carnobacterium maltaromaticum]|nr:hypothetical protein CYV33_10340 [Carnobacterium maltaromaticum]PLS36635.1 hypothetical protein CYV30_07975 [Carnobacterium maltaromaticum]PLS37450.1 hypothetical protein CYV31_07980 [Carnobacterium maltaromaticum]PLS43666.1 hypothetical protein CYV28_07990 [Carnobacterium maltaromaticum]PLS44010.1 hypothetical protein CYV27_10340 [Carnobacterium maltaromaticum]